jgi:hypothetical protein
MELLKREPFTARLQETRAASTFTGFCNRHDTELFRPLESRGFTATTEQCLLLAYRAVCRELYAKQGTLALEETLREADRGKPVEAQREVQEQISGVIAGSTLAVKDLQTMKTSMEACIRVAGFHASSRLHHRSRHAA